MAANNNPGDDYVFQFYGTGYVNVSIKGPAGQTYYGYATFDTSNGELEFDHLRGSGAINLGAADHGGRRAAASLTAAVVAGRSPPPDPLRRQDVSSKLR